MTKKKPDRQDDRKLHHKKQLVEAMQKSLGVVTQACKAVGLSRETFYRYYNNDEEFRKACDECQDIALDFVESKLYKQIEKNNPTSTIFYLKTKGKKRGYIERQEHDHYSGGQPFQILPISYADYTKQQSDTDSV